MGLFNISSIKDAIDGVRSKISELDREIGGLEVEISELVSLPLPYEDFCAWALTRYDFLGEKFAAEFKSELMTPTGSLRTYYMGKRTGHKTLDDFSAVFASHCPVPFEKGAWDSSHNAVSEKCFFFIFADAIKAKMQEMFDEKLKPEWPKNVGPARAERIKQLESMEAKLNDLVSTRDRINDELSGAGQ